MQSVTRRGAFLLAGGPMLAGSPARAAPQGLHDTVVSGSGDQLISADLGASGVAVRNVAGVSNGTVGAGHGVHLNAPGLSDWTFSGLTMRAKGYGFLINARAGGATGFTLTDFRLTGGADALELNTPAEALRNMVVWGGHLEQLGGEGANAGFGFGAAHVDGLVAGGFISHGSRLEGLHIEDGSRFVVLSSFLLRNCGGDGVRLLPAGRHPQHYGPAVLTAFGIEGTRAAHSAGIYCVYDPTGFSGRTVATAGYIRGFDTGLRLDGPGLFAADHVSVEDVDAVLELGLGGRAPGRFFSKGARAFVRSKGLAWAGEFHQEDAPPAVIVEGEPGCVVDGFSFPIRAQLKAGANTVDLFARPKLMSGRLSLLCRFGAVPRLWEADVHLDAGGLAVSGVLTDVSDRATAFSVVTVRNRLAVQLMTGPAPLLVMLRFAGTYYA